VSQNKRHIDGVWLETEMPVDSGRRHATLLREEGATFLRLALLRFIAADEHRLAERVDELIDLIEDQDDSPKN